MNGTLSLSLTLAFRACSRKEVINEIKVVILSSLFVFRRRDMQDTPEMENASCMGR